MAIILFVHGIGGMFNNGVNDFGNLFLNEIGFAPFGVYIAWFLKISHLICAVCLLINRFTTIVDTILQVFHYFYF